MSSESLEHVSFLYVEDDLSSRHVMELILTKAVQVKTLTIFEDSVDFLPRLKKLTPVPDIILLDIHVEPYDGFEMLKMIREDEIFHHCKIIALTASVMNEEVNAMREKGFDGTISKPIRMTEFPELMRRVVAGDAVWHIF